jgi:hypothetical protein
MGRDVVLEGSREVCCSDCILLSPITDASAFSSLRCVRDHHHIHPWLGDDYFTAYCRRCGPGDFVLYPSRCSDSRACFQRNQVGNPQLKRSSFFLQIIVLIVGASVHPLDRETEPRLKCSGQYPVWPAWFRPCDVDRVIEKVLGPPRP